MPIINHFLGKCKLTTVSKYDIINSVCEKLLSIKFENNLNFENHIVGICSEARWKFNILDRVAPYMNLSKNAFFWSSFSILIQLLSIGLDVLQPCKTLFYSIFFQSGLESHISLTIFFDSYTGFVIILFLAHGSCCRMAILLTTFLSINRIFLIWLSINHR